MSHSGLWITTITIDKTELYTKFVGKLAIFVSIRSANNERAFLQNGKGIK